PRIVSEEYILEIIVKHIQPEAIYTFVQPITKNVQQGRTNFQVVPIEVGLTFRKGMVIVLTQIFVIFPGASPKNREPIVGIATIRGRVAPDIPIVVRVVFRFT